MACSVCGAALSPGDRFCARCGAPAGAAPHGGPRFCTACGALVGPDDAHCARCGASILLGAPPLEEDAWPEGLDLEPEAPARATGELPGTAAMAPAAHPVATSTEILPTIPGPPPPHREPAGASPAGGRATSGGRGFPAGAALALLGGMAVVLSALLPWLSGGGARVAPKDIPSLVLVGSDGGPSLAILLLALGSAGALAAIVSMLVPPARFLRRVLGSLTLTVIVVFGVRFAIDLPEGASLLRQLGPGAYMAAAGALLETAAGRWIRR